MFSDILNLFRFLKYQKKVKRIFFFENSFVENHLEPYIYKNKNKDDTFIISFYKIQNQNLKKFKIFQIKNFFFLNLFFLLLETKYCYSSTPDIDFTAFKRSVFNKTKYIYIQHSPVGLIKNYRSNAFTKFDIVQVVNRFQELDLREINKVKNTKIKIWRGKYLFMNKNDINLSIKSNSKIKILIAPTWGTTFFKDKSHLLIKKNLNPEKYELFLRPHSMSVTKKDIVINSFIKQNFKIVIGKINFSEYDILISDWGGIYIEFAKIMETKSILIQNSEKNLNNEFYHFSSKSIHSLARSKLGEIIKLDNFENIQNIIDHILMNKSNYKKEINNFFKNHFY